MKSSSRGSALVKLRKHLSGTEVKIFDPRDASNGSGGAELLDPSVVKRGDQWWLYLAGQTHGYGATEIYSASLPPQSPLTATGWNITRDAAGQLQPLAQRVLSSGWDGKGGRHCPSHVRGWDPRKQAWVERIYYAGAGENLWGPYTIGFPRVGWRKMDGSARAGVHVERRMGTRERLRAKPHLSRRQMEDVVRRRIEP